MARSKSIRQFHRWISALFTVLVVVNIVSAIVGGPEWVGFLALPPLIVLLVTGIYLFWLPYRGRPFAVERSGR